VKRVQNSNNESADHDSLKGVNNRQAAGNHRDKQHPVMDLPNYQKRYFLFVDGMMYGRIKQPIIPPNGSIPLSKEVIVCC